MTWQSQPSSPPRPIHGPAGTASQHRPRTNLPVYVSPPPAPPPWPGFLVPVLARPAVRRVRRDDVAEPAEQPATADPQPRRHDQPEQPAQELAVVELAQPGDQEAQHRRSARVLHGRLPR